MKLNGPLGEKVFENNPQIKFFDISQNLIATYGEEKASNYFSALYLVYHPESEIWTSSLSDKKINTMRGYLKLEGDYDDLFAQYVKPFIQEVVNDPIAKMLALARIKLDQYFDKVMFLDFDSTLEEKFEIEMKLKEFDEIDVKEDQLKAYSLLVKTYESLSKKIQAQWEKLKTVQEQLTEFKKYNSLLEEYDMARMKYVEKKDTGELYGSIAEGFQEKRAREGKARLKK